MKKIRSIKTIITFCILFALSACAKPYPVHETEIVKITPSPLLLEAFPMPPFSGSTNEDLLLYTLSLEQNLSLCNARLSAIKKSVE